jgi:organic hydroperoxide reductase OsmC/OhrA
MRITAEVRSTLGRHDITLATNDQAHTIQIAPKPSGYGSSANGGELLFLALATCYCNDLYREAAKRGVRIEQAEVSVSGEFGAEGEAGRDVTYAAKVWARASEDAIRDLMTYTDRVAEIQNTLRSGTAVTLNRIDVVAL